MHSKDHEVKKCPGIDDYFPETGSLHLLSGGAVHYSIKTTILISAINFRRPDIVRQLLIEGASPDTPELRVLYYNWEPSPNRITPLYLATAYNEIEIGRILIGHGTDVNALSRFINLNVKSKFNPNPINISNAGKYSALHVAILNRNATYMQLLIQSGANLNLGTHTPLEIALHMSDSEAILRVLLQSGADPNLRDSENTTALQRALKVEANKNKITNRVIQLFFESGLEVSTEEAIEMNILNLQIEYKRKLAEVSYAAKRDGFNQQQKAMLTLLLINKSSFNNSLDCDILAMIYSYLHPLNSYARLIHYYANLIERNKMSDGKIEELIQLVNDPAVFELPDRFKQQAIDCLLHLYKIFDDDVFKTNAIEISKSIYQHRFAGVEINDAEVCQKAEQAIDCRELALFDTISSTQSKCCVQ